MMVAFNAEIVWICTDYGELKVHMFCDKTCYEKFGRESCILTSSHRGDLDWVAGFVLGAHFGFLEVREFLILHKTHCILKGHFEPH